ncbi:hypothetical protein B0A61_01240 [Flavobacterium aquatile LMG 4008 = ATCC 11947]|uniref:Uncharacterized protein n=1 Tax=Flavobacterium aquatile LMG 4008 = ATCC 11947 TaxID=1453498 RepID=A0A095SVX2_9FLAO|nr:hypothetical protein LG45_03605 [Flavobacterium aquatile LMG 4008 = ATCC 11947]OXA69161.1 hypothetical protein B0A61_01240 [Flavobacterium aquatile LMG 4008 = ATCC 11947]
MVNGEWLIFHASYCLFHVERLQKFNQDCLLALIEVESSRFFIGTWNGKQELPLLKTPKRFAPKTVNVPRETS